MRAEAVTTVPRSLLLVPSGDGHAGAAFDERARNRGANAAIAARNECDLVCQ